MCGPVLGLGVMGFALRRGVFRDVVLWFGVGQVGFAGWRVGRSGSLGCVGAWGVRFRGWGVYLGLGGVCADRFWAWV